MLFKYSIDEQLPLSLRKPPLTKKEYGDVIGSVENYGKKVESPDLSVVIVAYNEGDELIAALEKVYDQETRKKYEVVLVDNGLDQATKNRLTEFDLRYIKMDQNIGCSAGRNVGSVYAQAPVLSFVDADGYVNESLVEQSLRAIEKFSTAVRGKVIPKTPGSQTPPSYDLGNKTFSYYINAEGISVWDKEAFIECGGFEDVLYGGEGIILQNRMIEIYGIKPESFGYDPEIVLSHDYHTGSSHFKEKQTRYEIITRKIHMKYPFLAPMISSYNSQTIGLVPKITSGQQEISSKIEKIRLNVGTKFGDYYRTQYENRVKNPDLVNGSGDNPQFSVIIPCYNIGSKLNEAIDSVLRQTIPSLEIIVVDDVSTDEKTQEILSSLNNKVTLLRHKENQGVAAARNTGIKVAKAPYVLCLDGDDTIEMNYLEEAFNVFEADASIGLVSCWVQLVGARSGQWRPADKISIPEALLASPLPTATCFRKDGWKKAGGYDENMRGFEDWNFWLSVMKLGLITRVLPRPHFNYTISPDSKVNTSNKNSLDLVGKIYDNHEELYKKHSRYVITHKFSDYIQLRSAHINLKALHGDSNSISNLFRLDRYPSYAKRAYAKGQSFLRIAWNSKDPVYVSKLVANKMRIYSRTALRKLGLRS